MFIQIEGIDGCGKTTQCQRLKDIFTTRSSKKVFIVKDLDSTDTGKLIRKMLTEKQNSPEEELFAFLLAKRALFREIIIPETFAGNIVIADRGSGSFISYFQNLGYKSLFLEELLRESTKGLVAPTNTFLIDTPVEVSEERNNSKGENKSKFDMLGKDFFTQQRLKFLELAKQNSWKTFNGQKSVQDLSEEMWVHLSNI